MASIMFSDYQLMSPFINECLDDIRDQKCGRLDLSPTVCYDKQKSSHHYQYTFIAYQHLILYIYIIFSTTDQSLSLLLCGQASSSQGATIECLESKLKVLSPQCKLQILRVAELQSEDYHLNRPMYYACRDDREECVLVLYHQTPQYHKIW